MTDKYAQLSNYLFVITSEADFHKALICYTSTSTSYLRFLSHSGYKFEEGKSYYVTFVKNSNSTIDATVMFSWFIGEIKEPSVVQVSNNTDPITRNNSMIKAICFLLEAVTQDRNFFLVGTAAAVIHGLQRELTDLDFYAIDTSQLCKSQCLLKAYSVLQPELEVGEITYDATDVFTGVSFKFAYKGTSCTMSHPDKLGETHSPMKFLKKTLKQIETTDPSSQVDVPVITLDSLRQILHWKKRPKDLVRLEELKNLT